MDIGDIAEKLTRLSDSLWKWRAYIPLIAMTGLCVHLSLENRKLNLEKVQLLQQIIVEKDSKQDLKDKIEGIEKAARETEIKTLKELLNNSRQ